MVVLQSTTRTDVTDTRITNVPHVVVRFMFAIGTVDTVVVRLEGFLFQLSLIIPDESKVTGL